MLVDGVTEYAIMMLDNDGFVTSWNLGAERIKGYKSQEILGKHVSHFYTSEAMLANQPWQDLASARDKGRATDEGWRRRKDGTLFWANTVITALRDEVPSCATRPDKIVVMPILIDLLSARATIGAARIPTVLAATPLSRLRRFRRFL